MFEQIHLKKKVNTFRSYSESEPQSESQSELQSESFNELYTLSISVISNNQQERAKHQQRQTTGKKAKL